MAETALVEESINKVKRAQQDFSACEARVHHLSATLQGELKRSPEIVVRGAAESSDGLTVTLIYERGGEQCAESFGRSHELFNLGHTWFLWAEAEAELSASRRKVEAANRLALLAQFGVGDWWNGDLPPHPINGLDSIRDYLRHVRQHGADELARFQSLLTGQDDAVTSRIALENAGTAASRLGIELPTRSPPLTLPEVEDWLQSEIDRRSSAESTSQPRKASKPGKGSKERRKLGRPPDDNPEDQRIYDACIFSKSRNRVDYKTVASDFRKTKKEIEDIYWKMRRRAAKKEREGKGTKGRIPE